MTKYVVTLSVFTTLVCPVVAQTGSSKYKLLYSVSDSPGSSYEPYFGNLAVGPTGKLYGTTYAGGANGYGSVFVLNPPTTPAGTWTEETIYSFNNTSDGSHPFAMPVLLNGVLYGTTVDSEVMKCRFGCGTVWKLMPNTEGSWTLETLHYFARSNPNDAATVYAPLTVGPSGELYGASSSGGLGLCEDGCGTVFEMVPPTAAGQPWTESIIYEFQGSGAGDGDACNGALVIGPGGVLYGTTVEGGTSNIGTVFSLTPPGTPGGTWTEAVLYSFPGGSALSYPWAGVTLGPEGVLYGTTYGNNQGGQGGVYQLTPPSSPGGVWTEQVLHTFVPPDGSPSVASVTLGANGSLFGVTSNTCGTVFELSPPAVAGGTWSETEVHIFTGGLDGCASFGGLSLGKGGNLYGASWLSGNSGFTIFGLTQ